jgi:hypothetical protein
MIPLLFALACTPKPPPADPPMPEPEEPTTEAPNTAPRVESVDTAVECKPLDDGRTACFPLGHVCQDPHGIGDGYSIVVDCWTSGGRMCHPASEIWPACAGGWIQAG